MSENIVVEFDSFDLVNHNNRNPTVFWRDDTSNWGFATGTGGTSGAITTVTGIGSGATEVEIYGYRRRLWINNVVTWFDGDVTVDTSIITVPEPHSVAFLFSTLTAECTQSMFPFFAAHPRGVLSCNPLPSISAL